MMTSVVRAFFHSGGSLNADTPLEMASTPVTAAPPEAKACRMTRSSSAPVTCSGLGLLGGRGADVRGARRRRWP